MALSFALSEKQEQLRGTVRRFATEEVGPRARDLNTAGEFPLDLVHRMGELGLLGLPFPPEDGGAGADLLTFCLAVEEVGRVDQSLGITLESAVILGGMPLVRFGTEEQKRRWLPPLVRGERVAGFGLTEPTGGTDAAGLRTRATLDGDEWVIDGGKAFIGNAGTPVTSHVVITAITGERDGRHEITNLLVPAGAPGFVAHERNRLVGWHAIDNRHLTFDGCRVPVGNQLGQRGQGLANFLSVLDQGRVAIAALAVGLIQGCLDECVAYAARRHAFGSPIGAHQAIAFKIADLQVAAQTARDATWRAAWLHDQRRPYRREASVAKLYATEGAVTAAREACQVFGGLGFTTDQPVGRFYQDAKVLEVGEGTSEVQRLLIARALGLPEPR
ncbi:MAG: acyl-CoA dehydrogenase family protein [Actinomycetota bacterium]|nr:acyl-CoA dehydrogenase family protein [Actinomycetota bacterium]